mmetsp:Transcript_5696/g.20736  ORF Transcript_5696/g.20736 Transcript_5696/m.20736 type:complete len:101 (-) Transcript_5696:1510-1812(-)
MSLSYFGAEQLQQALHNHELQADECVHFHMDTHHMGVGGVDSWNPTILHKAEHYVQCQTVFTMTLDMFATHGTKEEVKTTMARSLRFEIPSKGQAYRYRG